MSTTTSQTRYNFNLNVSKGDSGDTGNWVLTSDTGITDEVALALAEAINGVDWPSGTTAAAHVTKHDMTEVQSEGDLNTTPPVFT